MQKFVMVSNYLNHHQIPFCNAMTSLLGGSFAFLQTEPVEEERLRMGTHDTFGRKRTTRIWFITIQNRKRAESS